MNHNQGRDIAVIGGGIGGLTAALAFARQGAKVTVYEQAPALTEVGAGLQITPNGARALHALDLDPSLAASGIQAQAVVPMDAVTGREIARFDLSRQTPRYAFYHRAVLIDILARSCQAAGVSLQLGSKMTQPTPDGQFQVDGRTVQHALIVGADGLHSVIRNLINPPEKPFFTGQVAWRATIKTDKIDPVARIWMAPGRHMVTYPLKEGLLNIVAVQERSAWADEGWHHADDPENLRAAFADFGAQAQAILSDVAQVRLWGLFRHPVAAKWHLGPYALLGDAAHPTLPFLAQGANLAIEDAFVLARCCDESASLEAGLRRYQDARCARVVRAIEAANQNARNYHLGGIKRSVAHAGLRTLGKVAPSAFLNRLSWLYDFDVTA